ncbi:MAG: VPLPA-CTERM sorting domain-containing protein [Rhodobacteraceae bacterium]|nr:VPLPA-CTERM sorting domain-containing protein [Paracoccaceae bacterium]
MFFVDTIDYCGGYNVNIVGCGFVGAAGLMVESIWAAGSYGAELLAHELGHNLGLSHGGCGLMGPALNHNTCLNASEVSTILLSSLVQQDRNGLYIEINPWLVTAAQVPLPAAGWLLIGGIGALAAARRRRKAA